MHTDGFETVFFAGGALSQPFVHGTILHRVESYKGLKGLFFFFWAWAQYEINYNNCAMNFSEEGAANFMKHTVSKDAGLPEPAL